MTQEAFDRGDWQTVIDAHRLESQDAAEWIRYGSTLLHSIEPGPAVGKQQQWAPLAAAQRQAVMVNLRQVLELVGIAAPAEPQPPTPLRRVPVVLGMHRPSQGGETKTLLHWANTMYVALLEQGSRPVQLQLFWEPKAGGGLSEAASQRRSVMVEQGPARVVFQLPTGAGRPRQLRLGLVEETAMVPAWPSDSATLKALCFGIGLRPRRLPTQGRRCRCGT